MATFYTQFYKIRKSQAVQNDSSYYKKCNIL